MITEEHPVRVTDLWGKVPMEVMQQAAKLLRCPCGGLVDGDCYRTQDNTEIHVSLRCDDCGAGGGACDSLPAENSAKAWASFAQRLMQEANDDLRDRARAVRLKELLDFEIWEPSPRYWDDMLVTMEAWHPKRNEEGGWVENVF